MAKVAVFGAGSWGTAFSLVLADAGNDVTIWGRRPEVCEAINERHENTEYFPGIGLPETVSATTDPEKAAAGAEFVVLSVPVILGYLFIAVFGLITLGLGWALFWLAWPATIVWAIVYYGSCFGGPHSATVGMRVMDLELRTWYGAPGYFVLGATHAVLFWVSISFLSPLVLLVGLFNRRRRLLHDVILGTIIINGSVRTQVAPVARSY